MAAIFQTTFSNAFSWIEMYEFRLGFHWSLFLRVQLTIIHHWFRQWLGAGQATSHCLNQWWLVYWRIYASLGLNELINRCPVKILYLQMPAEQMLISGAMSWHGDKPTTAPIPAADNANDDIFPLLIFQCTSYFWASLSFQMFAGPLFQIKLHLISTILLPMSFEINWVR